MDRLYRVDEFDQPFNSLDYEERDGFHIVDFDQYLPKKPGHSVVFDQETGTWVYVKREETDAFSRDTAASSGPAGPEQGQQA